MRRTGVWVVIGLIGAALAQAGARAQEPAPSTAAPPSAAPPSAAPPAGPIDLPQGPDWVAPEAGGPIPELPAVEPSKPLPPINEPPQSPPAPPPPAAAAAAATGAEAPAAGAEAARAPDPAFKEWGPPGAGPPADLGPPIQAALLLGIGGTLNDTAGSINPLGLGFGVRGAYRILPEVVVGGRFVYFVGGSAALATGQVSMSSWQLAVEAAYIVPITDAIELEPGILIGMTVLSVHGPRSAFLESEGSGFVPGSREGTDAALYVAPGAAVRIPIDVPDVQGFFVGGDARFGLQFRHEVGSSIELMGQVGVRF